MSTIESSNTFNVKINKPKYTGPDLMRKHQHLLLLLKHETPKGKFFDDIIPRKCSLTSKQVKIGLQKLDSACGLEKLQEFKSLAKMIPKYDEKTNSRFIRRGLMKLIKYELRNSENIAIIKFECVRILIGLIESSENFHSAIHRMGFINTLHQFRRETKEPILCKTYDLVRGLMRKYNITQ